MNQYSLFLVEDHKVFARALLRLLNTNQDLNVLGVAETAENALEQLAELNAKVDLVLADISLPKRSGIDLVEELHKKYPGLPCVVLSGHLSLDYVHRAMDAGARGYLIKENPRGLLEGIHRVLNGEMYISEEVNAL